MNEHLNSAHRDALELLQIVDGVCGRDRINYTIGAATLIYHARSLPFSESVPAIYISLLYPDFCRLRESLERYCTENAGFSLHGYFNTPQFQSLDLWFVKHSRVQLSQCRKQEEFYYGTKLVVTPLFYAGGTKRRWLQIYRRYRLAICALNSAAVLPKKPLHSYIKLSKKRILQNYLLKRRGEFSIRKLEMELGAEPFSRYVLYPFMVPRDSRNPNSVSWVVKKCSVKATADLWKNIKRITFEGVECSCVADSNRIIECFPAYFVEEATGRSKSQILLNGTENLRRIQLVQVELLTEFDRICRRNSLRYNISFGTLLGAARHKGFIPWDDDIDVTMPWEDYEKLDSAMRRDLDKEKYFYRTPESEANNHLIFKHLERRGTLYTKTGRMKLNQQIGVFIDIFPMYPAAPNVFFDWFHARICRFWRTALWATVGAESEKRLLKRLYYRQIAKFGNKKSYEKFLKAAVYFRNKKGRLKFWIAMDRNPYNVALVEMCNYDFPIELEFEGRMFLAPKNYEAVLNYCFGLDWRRYPSPEERVSLHNAVIEIGNLYEFEKSEENIV